MIYCVDVDGTICRTVGADYVDAEPVASRICEINALLDQGHEVIYFTARGSGTGIDHSELTRAQLQRWGARYTRLILGKPAADVYIDDRAMSATEFFADGQADLHSN